MIGGVEFVGDQPKGSAQPAAFYGLGRAVKTRHVYFDEFLPSIFGIVAPTWLPDNMRYSWGWFDSMLAAWRSVGFTRVTVVLSARHTVFCKPSDGPAPSSVAGYAPKDDRGWAELTRFARAFVARYRGVVEIVQAESEQQVRFWWADELEAHMRWHRILYRAVLELGGGSMRCFLGGHTFNGLLNNDPSDSEIERMIAALPEPRQSEIRRAIAFGEDELETGEFHGIDYHSYGTAREIEFAIAHTLDKVPGSWTGEFHVGDCLPGEPVLADPNLWNDGQPDLYLGLLRGDPDVFAELERRQVAVMSDKLGVMHEQAVDRFHVGPTRDWPFTTGMPWQGLTRATGSLRPVCDVLRGVSW